MDQAVLVIEQTEGGRKLIDQLVADGVPVDLAFWAREEDDYQWYLHIVSPEVNRLGPLGVYPRVRAAIDKCLWSNRREAIDPESVKVLGTTNRGVAEVRESIRRYPSWPIDRWHRALLSGGAAVSGLFIYAHQKQPASIPAG